MILDYDEYGSATYFSKLMVNDLDALRSFIPMMQKGVSQKLSKLRPDVGEAWFTRNVEWTVVMKRAWEVAPWLCEAAFDEFLGEWVEPEYDPDEIIPVLTYYVRVPKEVAA